MLALLQIAKPVSSLFKGRSETEAMSSEKEESTSEFARSSRIVLPLSIFLVNFDIN